MHHLLRTIRGGIVSRVLSLAVLVGAGFALAPAPAEACWGEFPRAERAFREGIEAFNRGDFALAIERFRESRDARREPDPSCTVQLYGRGPDSKAYYLPYYYLARSFYLGRDELPDADHTCPDAVHYTSMSLERRGETYDVYRRRFRSHLSDMDDLLEACGAESPTLDNIAHFPPLRDGAQSMNGGPR